MRNPNRASAMRALKNFEECIRADTWKGGGDPDFFDDIEQEYEDSKKRMTEVIHALTEGK